MLKKFDSKLGHWIILIILSVIWGSSFILIKRGLDAFSFEQVATLRIFIASIFLAVLGRKFYTNIPIKKLWPIFCTGVIGNGIPPFLFSKAQTYVDSGIVGVLNVLTPLFTILIGILFYNLKVKIINYLGVALGIIGTVYLLTPQSEQLNDKTLYYSIIAILGTVCYGWSANILKAHLEDLNAIQITTISFTFIGPWAGIYLFCGNFLEIMQSHPKALTSLSSIAILAIMSSAIAVIAFNKLIKMTGPLFATSCTYIIPIIAIIWGISDKEIIAMHHIIGFIIILSGVYLVNKRT
jgi:drug/metabolite transporter (DMT)-like permease